MRNPKVSVVIPVFNREATIQDAIRSVLEQTGLEAMDLIVVDDASTDGTVSRIEEVADPRIRLIRHSRNRGSGASRNAGIEAAQGDWIAFQDSDDIWLPGKLARQLELTDDPQVVAIYCGLTVEAGDGRTWYHPSPSIRPRDGLIQHRLLRDSFVSTQTLVARRSALIEAGCFDTKFKALEDWDLAIRLAGLGRFALVDEPLVRQRFSENSITRSHEKRLLAQILVLEKHAQLLAPHPSLLAFHHNRISGAARYLGDWGLALHHAREACRLSPLNPRSWVLCAYLALWVRVKLP
jgi:glycosyltransferase involved in cell wall biosynthesis